jgi:hypothetical protein
MQNRIVSGNDVWHEIFISHMDRVVNDIYWLIKNTITVNVACIGTQSEQHFSFSGRFLFDSHTSCIYGTDNSP